MNTNPMQNESEANHIQIYAENQMNLNREMYEAQIQINKRTSDEERRRDLRERETAKKNGDRRNLKERERSLRETLNARRRRNRIVGRGDFYKGKGTGLYVGFHANLRKCHWSYENTLFDLP